MAQQGATLQNYNNELVKCKLASCIPTLTHNPNPIHVFPTLLSPLYRVGIEDLREKREEVNRQILQEEEEKAKIQKVRK
jgi:Sjoegren syndrome nuclear autoantigen 1